MKFWKKRQNKPKIYNKQPKIWIYSKNPKHLLKQTLRWFQFRNISGDLIITSETDIDKVITQWTQALILWIVNVFLSGTLVLLATITLWKPVSFDIGILTYIFSYGIGVYVLTKFWSGIVTGLRSVVAAIPKNR
ncbi:MAG: hypothetical protein CL811_06365 [Colwelliaceae bacterium]|jgi:hypothetical protein|nr:hypothetical protein [Colwelliaceae bacterium]|tara:strand:+ start:3142 stop:3543 length:402 start_codon:yes stop_codon:yes gene_type:complete